MTSSYTLYPSSPAGALSSPIPSYLLNGLEHILSLVDQEARNDRGDRVGQLMDAWLTLGRKVVIMCPGEVEKSHRGEGLATLASSFFHSYSLSSRHHLMASIRLATQVQDPQTSTMLQAFGPLAFIALYLPSPTTDTPPTIIQQYYSEAIKIVFFAFTSLSNSIHSNGGGGGDDDDVESLQQRHLSVALPSLSHFLTTTIGTRSGVDTSSAGLLRMLVAQCLLSVARTAPTPFKEQVR